MRITLIPGISNATPIKPVQRIMRRKASAMPDPHEPDLPNTPPVITSISDFAAQRSKDETIETKDYQKHNPLWNTMLNL